MAGATSARPAEAELWALLETVADPEIPVISVVDLGIVRALSWRGEELTVVITPTYSGCPAMRSIEEGVVNALAQAGIERVHLERRLSPAWTTDWLSARGRAQLRRYGIAPPARRAEQVIDISRIRGRRAPAVACPQCHSEATEELSRFAATPCKALYRCRACREPFEYFKEH